MIVIQRPHIEHNNDVVKIVFPIILEERDETLWYSFPSEFEEFVVTENLDAALVGILLLALKSKSDIKLEGPVSARLFYTLRHYLIPALCLRDPQFKLIKIFETELNVKNLNVGKIAATGLSCGVDSFATFYKHEKEINPFEIKYFTFLNAGSHGDYGGTQARKVFHNRLDRVKKFSKLVDKTVIPIDSNLSELLKENFQNTHTFRNISCILNLQKLFRNYYYASAHRLDYYNLRSKDPGEFDILSTSMLSTESINFFSSVAAFNRIERTEMISDFSSTYNYLDVCTSPLIHGEYLNCSSCEKCLRTALTLDLLGKLHLYKGVFNIDRYKNKKNLYIGKVIATKQNDPITRDVFDLLKKTGTIQLWHYGYYGRYKLDVVQRKLRKLLKQKLNH